MFTKPERRVNKVFIHCSASDRPGDDNPTVIRQWHIGRGFSGIGYHFVITKDGKLFNGRDLEVIPAAQKGHNTGSIAICCTGLHRFTIEQMQTLIELCMNISTAYGKDNPITFHGHCEVANKLCPVFNYKEVLRLDKDGYMIRGIYVQ